MNRRNFLTSLFAGGTALVVPEIVIPSTRTIIDMNPQGFVLARDEDWDYEYLSTTSGQGIYTAQLRLDHERMLAAILKDLRFFEPQWMVKKPIPASQIDLVRFHRD